MDPDHRWARWTYEYAICYIFGPMVGAIVGGTVFNHMDQTMWDMQTYVDPKKKVENADEDDADNRA